MRDFQQIQPLNHQTVKAFFDAIGDDIKEVTRMHEEATNTYEKHNADMRLYCFETKLLIADAVKRFNELCQEMD